MTQAPTDLIRRLLEYASRPADETSRGRIGTYIDLCGMAADHIAALTAERDAFDQQNYTLLHEVELERERALAAEARADRLAEALKMAIDRFNEPMSLLNAHELGERLADDVCNALNPVASASNPKE